MHAQFSDPQQDIPAYHPDAPEKGQVLPPILSGNQLTGPFFREKWQVEVYKEAAQIPTRAVPAAVLLPLRSGAGAHEPA